MVANRTHTRLVRPGSAGRAHGAKVDVDARVAAVLEVLGGATPALVAIEHGVDPALLHRWVRAFVDSGTARLTNRPEAGSAEQRDRFLAALAHEIRTPLAVAQGWASLLADGDLEPDETTDALRRLDGALRQLTDRVREVELLAAASLGRLRLFRRPITLDEVSDHLPGRGEVGGEGGTTVLHVDPDLFRRVLRDLWQAACSTAPEPKSVRIEVSVGDPWTELRVVREGPAIDSNVLVALFEPFDRNDDATGVTLGLYPASALAVAHGGTLGAEQEADQGVLWLRIPSHVQRPGATAAAQ